MDTIHQYTDYMSNRQNLLSYKCSYCEENKDNGITFYSIGNSKVTKLNDQVSNTKTNNSGTTQYTSEAKGLKIVL
jgi:hypothetical protein